MARIGSITTEVRPPTYYCRVLDADTGKLIMSRSTDDLKVALAWCRGRSVYRIDLDGKPFANGFAEDHPLKNTPAEPPVEMPPGPKLCYPDAFEALIAAKIALDDCLYAEKRRQTMLKPGSPASEYTAERIDDVQNALNLINALMLKGPAK
jgi:hypothetical protein